MREWKGNLPKGRCTFLDLFSMGKTLLGTWISQSRVEGFHASGLFLKARKALESTDGKKRLKEVSSSSLVTHVGRPKTVIVEFKRTGSWRRMLGKEERKSLASLSEAAESASQTTASVDSRTCLEKDLKACCEKLMDETNLLHNSLGVSPVVEITLVEYLIMGGIFLIEGILCWMGRSECEIFLVDG